MKQTVLQQKLKAFLDEKYGPWAWDEKSQCYCDEPYNTCPMCVDDGVTSYCMLFKYALEEENYHCKRLKICKQSEVKE